MAPAVTAPGMGWLLAGSAVRGLAGGLLAAFGLGAIGGLYDDAPRPLLGGVAVAAGAGARVLDRATAADRSRSWVLVACTGLGTAFFSGDGLVPLAVMEGLDRGVVASAVAIGAGMVAWSLTGLRSAAPGRGADAAPLGLRLLVVALAAEAVTQTGLLAPAAALVVVVGAWAVGGLGIGLAYRRLSSQAFEQLPMTQVAPVATAVAVAETSAVVIGSLLGAGVYSLATSAGAPDRAAIGVALA